MCCVDDTGIANKKPAVPIYKSSLLSGGKIAFQGYLAQHLSEREGRGGKRSRGGVEWAESPYPCHLHGVKEITAQLCCLQGCLALNQDGNEQDDPLWSHVTSMP